FAEGIKGGAGEARIQASGGQALFILQVLFEFSAVDAQVGLFDISRGQPRVLMKLFHDGVTLIGGQRSAGFERESVVVHGEVFDFREQRLQIRVRLEQLFVIPRGCGICGKNELVGGIDAGIDLGKVGVEREVQDLRQQDDAVEIDAAVSFQKVGEYGRARGAVAFSE